MHLDSRKNLFLQDFIATAKRVNSENDETIRNASHDILESAKNDPLCAATVIIPTAVQK